jgi:hypothetical protein
MTTDRDFDRLARAWLELGPDEAPDRVVAAVLQTTETMPQVRRRVAWPTWRPFPMNRLLVLAGTAVLLVALVGGGAFIVGSRAPSTAIPSRDAAASTAPAASTTPLPSSTATPSASASPSGAVRVLGVDIDLRTATPLAKIDVGGFPSGTGVGRVASDGSTIWVTKNSEFVGVDPATSTVRTRLPSNPGNYSWPIAASPGALWTGLGTDANPDAIIRWDTKTGKSVTVPVLAPGDPLFADGSIWVPSGSNVVRIDPSTNKVLATVHIGPEGTTSDLGDLGASGSSIWAPDQTDATVAQIDSKTNKVVRTVDVPQAPGAVIATPGALWSEVFDDPSTLSKVDPAAGTTSWSTPFLGGITNPLVRPDAVWVGFQPHSSSQNGAILAMDPTSGKVVDGLSIPDGQVTALFEGFGSIWVVLGQQGIVERFSPNVLTISH